MKVVQEVPLSPPSGLKTHCNRCFALLETDGKENGKGKVTFPTRKGYILPQWEEPCPICEKAGKKGKAIIPFPIDKEPYKTYFLELNGINVKGVKS